MLPKFICWPMGCTGQLIRPEPYHDKWLLSMKPLIKVWKKILTIRIVSICARHVRAHHNKRAHEIYMIYKSIFSIGHIATNLHKNSPPERRGGFRIFLLPERVRSVLSKRNMFLVHEKHYHRRCLGLDCTDSFRLKISGGGFWEILWTREAF